MGVCVPTQHMMIIALPSIALVMLGKVKIYSERDIDGSKSIHSVCNCDDVFICRETGRCTEAELCCHAHPPPHIAILERWLRHSSPTLFLQTHFMQIHRISSLGLQKIVSLLLLCLQ